MISKSILMFLFLTITTLSQSFQPISIRQMNKFAIEFNRFEGGSFYDSSGTRKISIIDSAEVISEGTPPFLSERQLSFLKTFYDISVNSNYFVLEGLNLKANLGLRIGSVKQSIEYYANQTDLNNERRTSAELDPINQTSLLPAEIGAEYYLKHSVSSNTFYLIPSISASLPFGSSGAFKDSTLFANGALSIKPGINLGYANKKIFVEAAFKYLARSQEYSNQFYSSFRIEFRNIKKVNFYFNVEDYRVVDNFENQEFNFSLPQVNDSFSSIEAGAYLKFERFVGSFYLSQFVLGKNTLDRSAYGFSLNYLF